MAVQGPKAAGWRYSTQELLRSLEDAPRLADALEALEEELTPLPFPEHLAVLMERRGLNPARLSKRSLLSRSFLYQLRSGERAPGRDIVLRLALVLELTVDEAQGLLRSAQRGALYPRVRRDAALVFALSRHIDLLDTNELLVSLGETPIL